MSASRASEALGARRNLPGGAVFSILESFSGPAAYTTGGVVFKSLLLKLIDRAQVVGPTTSGFLGQVVTGSITGNSFTVQFFVPSNITGGGFGEVATGTSLASHGFYVLEEGQ